MKKDSIKCFISYSHQDKDMCKKFLTHFSALSRLYKIESWYDGAIPAGGNIDENIIENLNNSDIIFLLISQNFIASYYCFVEELKMAIEKHNKKEAIVIPVVIHSYVDGDYPFNKLKRIPSDGKPIDKFHPQNDGFVDAFTEIKKLLDNFFKV